MLLGRKLIPHGEHDQSDHNLASQLLKKRPIAFITTLQMYRPWREGAACYLTNKH